MAANFVQLLLLRVGVGIGEAGCQPPSQSLIVDHYPPEKRSGALGKFGLGKPVGAAIGLAAGGILAEAVGWRWTLVIAGAPGLLIGLLVLFTLKDPRQHVDAPRPEPQRPLGVVLRELAGRRSFLLFMLGMALLAFMSYGSNAFAASFYLRVHGDDIARIGEMIGVGPLGVIGLGMGLIGATAGALGSYLGGRLGDAWGARDIRALAWIPAIGAALGTCAYIAMYTVPWGALSLLLYMAPAFLNNVWNGPALLAVQNLAGQRARATAIALVLFVGSALGMGFGPLTIGAMSDVFAGSLGEGEGLRLAIVLVAVVDLLAAACFFFASRSIGDDLAAVARDEAAT
ncbi:MAG: MFS transporter [Phenylobacterium sp.]|nr:MFS transporter [Phenylobacterium sp.]